MCLQEKKVFLCLFCYNRTKEQRIEKLVEMKKMNQLKRRNQHIVLMVLVIILLMTCMITGISVKKALSHGDKKVASDNSYTESEELHEPLIGLTEKEEFEDSFTSKEGEFVLRSVGDILIHERVSLLADVNHPLHQEAVESFESEGMNIKQLMVEDDEAETHYDFAPMLAKIEPFTEYADATIANLEVIAAYPELPISDYPQFNAPSSILTNIKKIGVDIVSNGTNHTLDYYSEGALTSIQHIKEADLMYVGSYESFEDQQTSRIIDKNGIKVGFLTYSYGTNGIPVEAGKEYTISLVDIDRMMTEVRELNEQVDAVVVTLQLGQEYDTLPDDNQRFVFEMLSESGAKLILGGHPHVLQPMDWYGDTFAIYSQASFLSGQEKADNKQGGITEVTFKRQEDGEVSVIDPKFMPTYILGVPEKQMYEVVPYADFTKYNIPDGQEWWETIQERMTTYTENFQYVTHLETRKTVEDENNHR